MSEGTPPPPPPPSDNPYGTGGTPPPPPPPNQPAPGPGGYGAAPPPPPPVPGAGGYSAPEAFSHGWRSSRRSRSDLLVPMLGRPRDHHRARGARADPAAGHPARHARLHPDHPRHRGPDPVRPRAPSSTSSGAALAGLVVSLIAQMLGAGLIKNALNVVDDKPVSLSEIATWATKPQVIVAALIVAVATGSRVAPRPRPRGSSPRSSSTGRCSTSSTRTWRPWTRPRPASSS